MTVGIGIRCREGVLLAADSLEPVISPTSARDLYWLDDRKIQWLEHTDIALVVSGNVNDDALRAAGILPYRKPSPARQGTDPGLTVRNAHAILQHIDADVRARHPGADRYAEFDDPGPHTIFAVGEQGREPLLAKFTSKTETWLDPGGVVAIGSWLLGMYPELADEMARPAPDDLAACKALVVRWFYGFMQKVFGYQDPETMIRETHQLPFVGWPLQVLTMTQTTYTREVINCPQYSNSNV